MLDNNAIGLGLGIGRAGITLGDIVRYDDDQLPAVRYTGALAGASAIASQDRPVTDPDVIGATGFYYLYDRNAREWSSVASGGVPGPVMRPLTDPTRITNPDPPRATRPGRPEKTHQFPPPGPNRTQPVQG